MKRIVTYQRSQDRTGADGIDSDSSFLDYLVRERTRKRHDRTLGRRVINEFGVSDERVDTGVVDDARSPGHHRDQRLGEVEDGVDVGLEYVFPLII